MKQTETIAAIATGLGEAGVGVIRISGPQAVAVGERAFRPKKGSSLGRRETHKLTYGWVIDGDGRIVDEAMAVCMREPRSFTGEDVVEVHCHGGQVAVRRVLDAVLAAGARLAEPGEFTRRAFLNGRLDLAQAESVIDIIRAKTDRAMDAAVRQLRGGLSTEVQAVRQRLLEVTAHLEADIDFPELELDVQTMEQVEDGCLWSLSKVNELLQEARKGSLLREGIRVVLAGRPNVGKSSLLNRIVRENRAIVTEIPGTTRDVIEEWISIQGIPVAIADTAGIRHTSDVVERMGVDRSMEMLEKADLILLVIDAQAGVTPADREVMALLPRDTARAIVVNKVDLVVGRSLTSVAEGVSGDKVLGLSTLTGEGLDELESYVAGFAGLADPEESLVANARQEEALRTAAEHLNAALMTQRQGLGPDLVSIDIRSAWVSLGEITGESVGEDLLDQIFSRFCIGK